MAALDFGMALSRGMLPTSEKAQKDLLNLAGGRNVFKSEDWWNTQVDKQISEGYREREGGIEYLMSSGEYQLGNRFISPGMSFVQWLNSGMSSSPPPSSSVQYGAPIGAVSKKEGGFITRSVDVFGPAGRTDYTAGELSDIEKAAKTGASRAKQEAAKAETAKKRLTRGTGGLAAKAIPIGGNGGTGLPELGTGGLQLGATSLGKGLFV